ncbi:MAG: GntR family transcriptional regulator [Pseudomonadota bacterium]
MTSVPKTSRVEDAYARLKSQIRSNALPPGFQATEPEIAVRLGMSRTPVREALIRLDAEGLVDLIPRRGVRVLPISPTDMRDIYEILTALEPAAASAVAARRPSEQELAPLELATSRMEAALDAGDLDAWAEHDDAFHNALLDLHGNQRLTAYVASLFDQVHRARIVTLRLRDLPVKSTQEHRELLSHLRSGDSEAARTCFASHRKSTANELLGLLEAFKLSQL